MMLKKSISNSHLLTIFLALVLTISAIEVMPVKADSLPASLNFINYTFTVNSTLDLPDDLTQPGTCHTAANSCTLRAAIMQANRAGFIVKRQSGSHVHLWRDGRRMLVTVPYHEERAPGTLISIIKQSKMDRDEFLTYLE